MFDGLKKKFSNFIHSVAKKEEENIEKPKDNIQTNNLSAKELSNVNDVSTPKKTQEIQEKTHINSETKNEDKIEHKTLNEIKANPIIPNNDFKKQTIKTEENTVQKHEHKDIVEKEKNKSPIRTEKSQKIEEEQQQSMATNRVPTAALYEKNIQDVDFEKHHISKYATTVNNSAKKQEETEKHPKVSFGTKLKGVFMREVTVKEGDISPFLDDLEVSLLQSDVNLTAAEKILKNIRQDLVGKKISSKDIELQIEDILKSSILGILKKSSGIDLIAMANEKRNSSEPLKILFIGPNGAGKTTTMAKLANMFIKNNLSVVLSASDTFRAAAIEQTAIHAERLGIGVIKGRYGADPASVAFDAVAHAKAHHINVVLIDSAGRQETNKSLMEEVKKIVRIAKPDIKIFVGESITGNSLLIQVNEFNATIGLDGVILTKLDCDAKGGNTISILSETNVPILFFGTGEGYDDLLAYSPEFIINNIIAS